MPKQNVSFTRAEDARQLVDSPSNPALPGQASVASTVSPSPSSFCSRRAGGSGCGSRGPRRLMAER